MQIKLDPQTGVAQRLSASLANATIALESKRQQKVAITNGQLKSLHPPKATTINGQKQFLNAQTISRIIIRIKDLRTVNI